MNAGEHAEVKEKKTSRGIISLLIMVILVFGVSFALREFVVQGYQIPTGSMEDTVMIGDTVFSEQVSYHFRAVEPGDVITFQDPEVDNRVLLKRVIAVAGQTVELKDGKVYVDGVALDEPYTEGKPSNAFTNTIASIRYPYTVPEGTIWVMGDNRTNSLDSRYFGPISVSSVNGRAFVIYWPLEHFNFL